MARTVTVLQGENAVGQKRYSLIYGRINQPFRTAFDKTVQGKDAAFVMVIHFHGDRTLTVVMRSESDDEESAPRMTSGVHRKDHRCLQ